MKEGILKISKDLEKGSINETEAQTLLLSLFGVIKSVCEHDYMRRGGPAVYYLKCIKCGKTKM
jgi:hypothetical protein